MPGPSSCTKIYVAHYPQSEERIHGKDIARKVADPTQAWPDMIDRSYVLGGDHGVMKMTLGYDSN